jgi:dTDP-4-dehydrorhamnose 3,5-epimerase
MKNIISYLLPGVRVIENFLNTDKRGHFVKTFHASKFRDLGFTDLIRESYYSESNKDVIRGMHFQKPPFDHEKLIYVTKGKILDVILDLRTNLNTYGQYITVELGEFGSSIYIPKGLAHGFLVLSDTATVIYNVTTEYNKNADTGIRWDSFGFEWPVKKPIISDRDLEFDEFEKFRSPF